MAFTQLIFIESSDRPITLLHYINSLPSIEDDVPSHRNAVVLFDQQKQQPPALADSQLDLYLSSSCPAFTIASSSSSSCVSSSNCTSKRKATTHDRPRPLKRTKKNSNTVLLDAQVSTELTLAPPDPFVIKKTLEDSDVNNLARLMLSKEAVETHLLPYWDDATKERLSHKDGVVVKLWDMDEECEHDMKMKLWGNNKSYVMNDRWITKIVRNRKLEKGDQIGLFWDGFDSRLMFSVLQRRSVQEQQPIQATPIRFCAPPHHHTTDY